VVDFKYFKASLTEELALDNPYEVCELCGEKGFCIEVDETNELQVERGCLSCLQSGKFKVPHDTDIGFIAVDEVFPPPKHEPEDLIVVAPSGEVKEMTTFSPRSEIPEIDTAKIEELRCTPAFSTWQDHSWPVHCNDFMGYYGSLSPKQMKKFAKDRSIEAFFHSCVDPEWEKYAPTDENEKMIFEFHYFRCLSCDYHYGFIDFD